MKKNDDKINSQNSEYFEALRMFGEPLRMEILMLFAHSNEYNAGEIASKFDKSRPTISHHLNSMRRAKILLSRRDGKEIFYSLNKKYVVSMIEKLLLALKCC